MNKRFAMLRLPCSVLRILKRLHHINAYLLSEIHNTYKLCQNGQILKRLL
ncbi:MAG: hypothetical protein LBH59_07195 [Planctomycetaceae bacterium]|nr:hypothetical protein [Planctomycetaceae bacterium]